MILKWGGYPHGQNEVALTITRRPLKTSGGIYYAYDEQWNVTAFPGLGGQNATQAQITAAINALTNAYSVDGNDLVLYLDDGSTPSAHALYSALCNGGTRVIETPSFPDGKGAQYASYRSYSLAVAGEVPVLTNNVLLEYTETIQRHGTGGPITVYIPVARGPWVKQQTSEQSTFRVTQSGSAKALLFFPTPPAPIWPDAEIQQERTLTEIAPIMRNGRYYNYGISWSYTFEASGGFDGAPNNYPIG